MEKIDVEKMEWALLIKDLVEFASTAREGLGIGIDNAKSLSIDEKLIDGSIRYAAKAAQMCLVGESEDAFKKLHEAEKEGFHVNRSLGDMYYYGIGVKRNLEEARRCYKTSLDYQEKAGVADTLGDYYYQLSRAYRDGIDVDADVLEAQLYLAEAYKYGSLRATFDFITYYYRNGDTVDDLKRAIQLCREAIKQIEIKQVFDTNAAGLIYLAFGYMILNPSLELGLTDESAFEAIKKAAELGNSEALYVLGTMYECGYETDQNLRAAVKCYAEAKKLGNKRACEAKREVKDKMYKREYKIK